MIGTALSKLLASRGYKVVILTRKSKPEADGISYAAWDLNKQTIDEEAIRSSDYIIHLAGANVGDKRWTPRRKEEILQSRTKGSALLLESMRRIPNNIKALISASAIGWYGPDPANPNPHPFTEDSPSSNDFLGQTCHAWEDSLKGVPQMGKRLVTIRTGPVLSNKGGALARFIQPIRLGVAPILGTGRQIMSWIHIDDICRIYLAAIENDLMNGVYNAVAPEPVSNKELVLLLANEIKKKFFLPVYVPSFLLKILFGELSIEVLKSATVSSKKLQSTGFQFIYPTIAPALEDLAK